MEAFSRMVIATVERGLMSGFSVGLRNQEEMIVSHLLFADDMLIFCEPTVQQFRNLRYLFLCFEAVSRLKIVNRFVVRSLEGEEEAAILFNLYLT